MTFFFPLLFSLVRFLMSDMESSTPPPSPQNFVCSCTMTWFVELVEVVTCLRDIFSQIQSVFSTSAMSTDTSSFFFPNYPFTCTCREYVCYVDCSQICCERYLSCCLFALPPSPSPPLPFLLCLAVRVQIFCPFIAGFCFLFFFYSHSSVLFLPSSLSTLCTL